MVQPRRICWVPAPCGKARGAAEALRPVSGQTSGDAQGRNTKRRALSWSGKYGRLRGGRGCLNRSESPEILKDPRDLVTGAYTPTTTLIFVPNGGISGAASGEVSRGQRAPDKVKTNLLCPAAASTDGELRSASPISHSWLKFGLGPPSPTVYHLCSASRPGWKETDPPHKPRSA